MKNLRLAYLGFTLLLGFAAWWLGQGANAAPAPLPAGCACGCGDTPRPFCAHRCGGNPCTGATSAQPSAAAGCTCGCGGTPRPACAHSCGGDPCTGGALRNSRMIIGQVVEKQPASFSVVGQNGNALTGFVVEFDNGQRATTDNRGEATFTPAGRKQLRASIPGIASTAVEVLTAEQARQAPARVPHFATAGNEMRVTRGSLFDGRANNTNAMVGSQRCAVMFESPSQAILHVPAETPLGSTALHIEDQGQTLDQPLSVVSFALRADKLTLIKGESTRGMAVIEGADQSLAGGVVRIHNLSTEIIALELTGGGKGNQLEKRIEPGMIRNGRIEIPFTIRSRRGGGFQIIGGVFDPQTMGATCSCGCGGTPRPACAHSCGGNPCTGGAARR